MSNGSASKDRTIEGGYIASNLSESTTAFIPSKAAALRTLTQGRQVVYAMRMTDGAIKIGCTRNLANRSPSLHAEILGFRFGTFADEKAIHDDLRNYRVRGYEYYHPSPPVLAVVNAMRDAFGLPRVSAD